METESLPGKARRHLRALGHHLKPVVLVGKDGLSTTLIEALEIALADHELVKVRIGEHAAGDRHELAERLATGTKAHLVGMIGRTLLLYRRHPHPRPNKPQIVLPTAAASKKLKPARVR